jgi:hypothetical protein
MSPVTLFDVDLEADARCGYTHGRDIGPMSVVVAGTTRGVDAGGVAAENSDEALSISMTG